MKVTEWQLCESLGFAGLHQIMIQLVVITEKALTGNAYCTAPSF